MYKKKKLNKLYVQKVNDKDVNLYINFRNLDINVKNSIRQKKISTIDHYIWWFESYNRKSYFVLKNNLKLLILYETYCKLNNKHFVFPGFISSNLKISIFDLLWSIKWQNFNINKNKKKMVCVIAVPKNNFFSNMHTKYFGYIKMNKNNENYFIVKKELKINYKVNLYYRMLNEKN